MSYSVRPLDPNRPTAREVAPIIAEVYRDHLAGCCLHIVTDDYNLAQEDAEYVLGWAVDQDCSLCVVAALLLCWVSYTQRRKAIALAHSREYRR